jgi:hypothetical protein
MKEWCGINDTNQRGKKGTNSNARHRAEKNEKKKRKKNVIIGKNQFLIEIETRVKREK